MTRRLYFSPAAGAALLAALLFGASTPFAKELLRGVSPVMLAGLLYLGSGVGLGGIRLLRDRGWRMPGMARGEWLWLLLAIGFGGVLGPAALLFGLATTSAASASLLLNLEAVLTAAIAWGVFRENAGRNVVLGMAAIVVGAVLLAVPESTGGAGRLGSGAALIAGACLCWAIDNNLTRKVSAEDALFLASLKGGMAGLVNIGLALSLGARFPALLPAGEAMLVGLLDYGASLVLFVLALRGLGTARTGAYFSTAPFLGAAIAVLGFGDEPSRQFWAAAALMAVGVFLHLAERHEHLHTHEAITHTHRHRHDAHHQHTHSFAWNGEEPHTHPHTHAALTHSHPHYPDIHHQHRHE